MHAGSCNLHGAEQATFETRAKGRAGVLMERAGQLISAASAKGKKRSALSPTRNTLAVFDRRLSSTTTHSLPGFSSVCPPLALLQHHTSSTTASEFRARQSSDSRPFPSSASASSSRPSDSQALQESARDVWSRFRSLTSAHDRTHCTHYWRCARLYLTSLHVSANRDRWHIISHALDRLTRKLPPIHHSRSLKLSPSRGFGIGIIYALCLVSATTRHPLPKWI